LLKEFEFIKYLQKVDNGERYSVFSHGIISPIFLCRLVVILEGVFFVIFGNYQKKWIVHKVLLHEENRVSSNNLYELSSFIPVHNKILIFKKIQILEYSFGYFFTFSLLLFIWNMFFILELDVFVGVWLLNKWNLNFTNLFQILIFYSTIK
jgi:hypothetical protein